jgi:hypothetical protein
MNQQQQLDFVIVTVYMISVAYVLFRAIDSVDNQTKVKFKKDNLDEQLEERNLKDIMDISFKFEDRYKFEDPKDLSITITNKSSDKFIQIDWENSSIVYEKKSFGRLVRITADKRTETAKTQVPPNSSSSAKIAAVDLLETNPETKSQEPKKPIVDIAALQKTAQDKKPKDKKAWLEKQKLYLNFMRSKQSLGFSMWLRAIIQDIAGREPNHSHDLLCEFEMTKIHWTEFLPIKK